MTLFAFLILRKQHQAVGGYKNDRNSNVTT